MKKRITLIVFLLSISASLSVNAAEQVNVGLKDVINTVEQSFKGGNNAQTPINDFIANFFQRTVMKKDGREMRGDGVVSVRIATGNTPLMFRFQYYRPNAQEIISNGRSLWIYHPENREVILSDVSSSYNRPGFNPDRDRAVNFLQGLGRISKDFHINFASGMYDTAGNYVLELNPRRAMLNTRRILLVVNRDAVLQNKTGGSSHNASTSPNSNSRASQQSSRSPFSTPAPFAGMPAFSGGSSPISDTFPLLSTTVEDQEGNGVTMEFTNIKINNRLSEMDFSFTIPAGVQVVKPTRGNQPR